MFNLILNNCKFENLSIGRCENLIINEFENLTIDDTIRNVSSM